jgi:hypothetical protein
LQTKFEAGTLIAFRANREIILPVLRQDNVRSIFGKHRRHNGSSCQVIIGCPPRGNSICFDAEGYAEFQQAGHPYPKRQRLGGFEPAKPDGNKNATTKIF